MLISVKASNIFLHLAVTKPNITIMFILYPPNAIVEPLPNTKLETANNGFRIRATQHRQQWRTRKPWPDGCRKIMAPNDRSF
ncbi:unnamed protein product [Nezara viridula]|uniref:Uncharacterized protein n=1 Tax=Nezara viridula TaxID=85310 RepID=A0A9P0HMC5_NEZVI|nr:unnamed protein product [Nezara viridula]